MSDTTVGEVRREDHGGGHSVWQVEENEDGQRFWRCTYSSAPGNRGEIMPLDNDARGWDVIGAVPGTPAEEAQKPNLRTVVDGDGDYWFEVGPNQFRQAETRAQATADFARGCSVRSLEDIRGNFGVEVVSS